MMADVTEPRFAKSARKPIFAFTCSGQAEPEWIQFSRDTLNYWKNLATTPCRWRFSGVPQSSPAISGPTIEPTRYEPVILFLSSEKRCTSLYHTPPSDRRFPKFPRRHYIPGSLFFLSRCTSMYFGTPPLFLSSLQTTFSIFSYWVACFGQCIQNLP